MVVFDQLLTIQGGGYISTLKVIPILIVLLAWARLLTWADVDAQAAHLPRTVLNLGNLSGLVVAFALFFLLPTFILAFLALIIVAGAEAGVYLALRNKRVGLKDLNKQFKAWLASFKGKKEETNEAGKVTLYGKDGKALPVPDSSSPDRPAYDAIQLTLTDPITRNAQQIDLAPEGDSMVIKYIVDNFTHVGGTVDRTVAGAAISYIKWAAGLNIEDKRKPQTGTLKANLDKGRHDLKIQTAGTTSGEYLRILVDPKGRHSQNIDELGLTKAEMDALTKFIKEDKGGIILLSTPKGHGLTSLFYSVLRAHDVFLEHVQTIERDQEQDVEGITQNKLPANAAAGEEFKMVDWVCSQEPDVVGVSKVEDPKTAATLVNFARSSRRAYVCMRANSTFDALEQWKRIAGGTEGVKAVLNGRVLRKLCEACKEEFTPDPTTLKKLNLNPERVTTLFKAREQPLRDPKGKPIPCDFCHDLHFKGRTGVFELLVVDDDIRQTMDAGKALNQPFRKQRGRYLQEEALDLVEKGETSVQEVLRVLKPAPETQAAAPAAAKPKPAAGAAAPVRNR
ncbi:MAG TPA: ATPase, T2SS/T4P/T4SS family [Tepidisphaeraceae bacterium]|jgi:type II secretory ATPase GspE/PulE/Tfp pilus assembly ATPase PilB-like protein|nr:ATPase, T2SS/T4P/T4SS family [Tepidisphaeraceae bacterium]